MSEYSIDLLITSSSRPQLFPHMWESFNKMIYFRGKKRVIIHEDCIYPEKSKKTLQYIDKLKETENIEIVLSSNPHIGLSKALDNIFTGNLIKNKYMFYLQEDWIFERPIDLDQILWTMDTYEKINLVVFNKIRNTKSLNGIKQKEFDYEGLKMCLYHCWSFMPSIWRMSHALKYWKYRDHHPEGYMTNQFGTHEERGNLKHLEENVGAYLYGPSNDWRYVRHIGNDWRMADWRRENGEPGGVHDKTLFDDPYMAPWVDYPFYEVRTKQIDKEKLKKEINEQPKEAND